MTTVKKSTRKGKSKKGGMLPLAAIAASVPIVIDIVKELIDKKGSGSKIPRGSGSKIPRKK